MLKTILLARPHPLIIAEMKPFLDQNGFSSKKLDSLASISTSSLDVSGAIISLAVTSSIGGSVEEVFSGMRHHAHRLPILFTAMQDFAAMKGVLRRLAKSNEFEATILGADSASENHPDLGKPNTLLYLSMGDLSAPNRRELASRMVQRHFS